MEYVLHLFILICFYTMLSQSLNLSAGFAGLISLTHAGFYGIGAYTTAILSTYYGFSFWPSIPLAMLISGFIAFIVSLIALRTVDDYFIICTLGIQVILFSIMNNWMDLTRGPLGIPGIPSIQLLGFSVESKLTRLGSEGRSTSTTITAFSILNQLDESGYPARDQKLLSFTDNRQDAALQAGHFNDFVQVVRLRAGIHKALLDAPGNELSFATIGERVFQALALPFLDFANRNEDPAFANVRRNYEQCFQNYLFYRVLADLKRSWRIILPNLEQCALLNIEYLQLNEVVADDTAWQDMPLLNELSHSDRHDFLRTILDFYRLEYAIHSENYLTQSKVKENEKQFREMLRPPWTLDRNENLREPFFIRYDPLPKSAKLFSKSMGPASALGKFIKLFVRQRGLEIDLKGER